jgi:hypothetical protein
MSSVDPAGITDDDLRADIESWDDKRVYLGIGQAVIQIICQSFGIYGAISFGPYLGVSFVSYIATAIYEVMPPTGNIPAALLYVLFACPHFFLIKEIEEGIMTEQNYPNEKYSCCCV